MSYVHVYMCIMCVYMYIYIYIDNYIYIYIKMHHLYPFVGYFPQINPDHIPSSNQTWQWKMNHLSLMLLLKPHSVWGFSTAIKSHEIP